MNRKEFYNTLSDEVKAKIKTCKTEEEMLEVLGDAGVELDLELLEGVSGGRDLLAEARARIEEMAERKRKEKAASEEDVTIDDSSSAGDVGSSYLYAIGCPND